MVSDAGPATREELRAALDEIVLGAYVNGVEVADHGYSLDHDDPDVPDWDLLITEVDRSAEIDGGGEPSESSRWVFS